MPEGSLLPMALMVVFTALVCGFVVFVAVLYNQLAAARQLVSKAFSDIDVLIQRRNDEIPKLVDLCKGWMEHEKSTLEEVTRLRAKYGMAASVQQKIGIHNILISMLAGIFGKAEKYPELKGQEKMLDLQKKISQLESQIAGRREHFNRAVTAYNIFLQQIPACYIAAPLRFSAWELLKTSQLERLDVDVSTA